MKYLLMISIQPQDDRATVIEFAALGIYLFFYLLWRMKKA